MRILGLIASFLVLAHTPLLQAGVLSEDTELYRIPNPENVLTHWNTGRSAESLPKRFKVVVWNTHKEYFPLMMNTLNELSENADLFLGQEGYLTENFINFFGKNPSIEWTMATSFYLDDKDTGVYTGSHANAQKISYLRTRHTEPFIKSPKVTLITYYNIEGSSKLFLVINIHALNAAKDYKHFEQLREIEKVIAAHDGPVLFAGDFNSWQKDRLDYLEDMKRRHNLKEVTFFPDLRKLFYGRYVFDHSYFRGFNLISSRTVLRPGCSDHNAMEFELELINE